MLKPVERDKIVLLGCAPSVNDVPLVKWQKMAYLFACNRFLLKTEEGGVVPDGMIISDRQVYWQEIRRMRAFCINHDVVLATSMFSTDNKQRGIIGAPGFDGKATFIKLNASDENRNYIPPFDMDKPFLNGKSVAILMVQVAIASGFKRVGLCGIDLVYKGLDTHMWGKGAKFGAFKPHVEEVLERLKIVKKNVPTGVVVANLSPQRGPVDKIFAYMSEKEFFG